MILKDILETFGETPIVKLNKEVIKINLKERMIFFKDGS